MKANDVCSHNRLVLKDKEQGHLWIWKLSLLLDFLLKYWRTRSLGFFRVEQTATLMLSYQCCFEIYKRENITARKCPGWPQKPELTFMNSPRLQVGYGCASKAVCVVFWNKHDWESSSNNLQNTNHLAETQLQLHFAGVNLRWGTRSQLKPNF